MLDVKLPLLKKISKILTESKDAYVFGTDAYDKQLDSIIDELTLIKNTLRKNGKNVRRYHRKEAASLQNAVTALRYLKRKSERKKEKLLLQGNKPKK